MASAITQGKLRLLASVHRLPGSPVIVLFLRFSLLVFWLASNVGTVAFYLAGHPSGLTSGHPSGLTSGHPSGLTSGHPSGLTSGHPSSLTACHPAGYIVNCSFVEPVLHFTELIVC